MSFIPPVWRPLLAHDYGPAWRLTLRNLSGREAEGYGVARQAVHVAREEGAADGEGRSPGRGAPITLGVSAGETCFGRGVVDDGVGAAQFVRGRGLGVIFVA